MADKVLNVYVKDRKGRSIAGAEVTWTVKHGGIDKTIGPSTTLGFDDKPVEVQISSELDSSLVDLTASYPGASAQTKRVNTVDTRQVTFTLDVELAEVQAPAASLAGAASPPAGAPVTSGGGGALNPLLAALDRAISHVKEARFFYGVVAAAVVAAIINLLIGLTRPAFVTLLLIFAGMFLFYIFSGWEKATDPVLRFAGRTLVVTTIVAFVAIAAMSLSVGLLCKPRVFVYLYGVSEACVETPAAPKS